MIPLGHAKGSVADAYHSMADFWAALRRHELGLAGGSVWDTYEAGERRELERVLASLFKAPAAVVVCSGMGAIAVSILSTRLITGGGLQTGWTGYFEIAELIDDVLRPAGLVTCEVENTATRLIEPISNAPTLSVNLAGMDGSRGATVIDNSLFSMSLPWSVWRDQVDGPLCVIESIPKYLEPSVSGGVVFGDEITIRTVRSVARRLGMLMPRQACGEMLGGSMREVPERLRKHARGADVFARVLRLARPELVTRVPHQIARAAGLSGACSSLVFVLYPDELSSLYEFEAWAREISGLAGSRPAVRAGYGWPLTYGRAYGKDALNTSQGTQYLRFSVGLEYESTIETYASALRRPQR